MPRYRLSLEYDGGPFVGWQRQTNGLSVQEALETAVFKFCGETTNAVAAGRTDAGVHARAMTAHIDLAKDVRADVVRDALNYHLKPNPIAVLDAVVAAPDFHARFSAVARHYEYVYIDRRAPLALDAERAWRVAPPLDHAAMHAAAQALVGKHDFTTFRAAGCQAASPVKTLSAISVRREGEAVRLSVSAPSFLHNQVRSIAGSLFAVGARKWRPRDVEAALAARQRSACGQTAPPEGLYFVRADYPLLGEETGNAGDNGADKGRDRDLHERQHSDDC